MPHAKMDIDRDLTLVTLFLALDSDGQVLSGLPVNLITLGVVIDEVPTIAALVLVEVCLCDRLIAEELVLGKLEDEAEAGFVKILHADISQTLERGLVSVCDHLRQ